MEVIFKTRNGRKYRQNFKPSENLSYYLHLYFSDSCHKFFEKLIGSDKIFLFEQLYFTSIHAKELEFIEKSFNPYRLK